MSFRIEKWKDDKTHNVYRDDKGMFAIPMVRVERVDWLTEEWVNRKITKFNPKIHRIYHSIENTQQLKTEPLT